MYLGFLFFTPNVVYANARSPRQVTLPEALVGDAPYTTNVR